MYILHLSDIHYRRELGCRKKADQGPLDGTNKKHGGVDRAAGPDGYQAMLSAMQNPLVFLDDCLDRTLVEHLADAVFRVEYGAVVPVER